LRNWGEKERKIADITHQRVVLQNGGGGRRGTNFHHRVRKQEVYTEEGPKVVKVVITFFLPSVTYEKKVRGGRRRGEALPDWGGKQGKKTREKSEGGGGTTQNVFEQGRSDHMIRYKSLEIKSYHGVPSSDWKKGGGSGEGKQRTECRELYWY